MAAKENCRSLRTGNNNRASPRAISAPKKQDSYVGHRRWPREAVEGSGRNGHHSLENAWTFWFDSPSAKSMQSAWGDSIRPVYTFSTIEEFWSVYNNIYHPSKMVEGADFHCFKHKVEPKWEDPICAHGGKWTATFARGKSDASWLYTLLAMIGEQFDHRDEICGAVVSVRPRQEKISLWTRNAFNFSAQVSIGKQWKDFLDYSDSIGYIFHDDAQRADKAAKKRYTV
ncbi:hypothetical protein MLD38_039954 [Melastoma candidum]|uniref:Uncharacterized protein n=1 Tax=Melastoma candidum TaxID=119954 RepID=A0ACB9L4N0_9MYRT|nr:hypothetical protein MLD38_039954 [Melastoma candidum]